MKKIFKIALSVALLAGLSFGFTGCKKGEDDPAISLRSRDARVTGEWTLTGYEYSEKRSNGTTETHSYDGSQMTVTITSSLLSKTSTYKYSETMNIEKGGKYSKSIMKDGGLATRTSNWNWLSNDKKKTTILLDDLYNIVELRNNKMVLVNEYSSSYKGEEAPDRTNSEKLVLTYEKK